MKRPTTAGKLHAEKSKRRNKMRATAAFRRFGPGAPGAFRRFCSAFTLIELVLAFTLLAILAALVQPRMVEFLNHERVLRSAERAASDLRLAQSEAIKQQTPTSLSFYPADDAYTVDDLSPDPTGDTDRKVLLGTESSYRTAVESADFGGSTDVTFDSFGLPSAGGTVVVGLGNTTCTVSIDGTSGIVTVGPLTGVATRVSDPVLTTGTIVLTKKEKG